MPPTRRRARQVPDPLERAQLQATLAHAATVLYAGAWPATRTAAAGARAVTARLLRPQCA